MKTSDIAKPEDPQLLHLRKQNDKLQSENEQLRVAIGGQKELKDAIVKAVEAADPFPRTEWKRHVKSPEAEAVICLGDWHTREVIKENQVERVNAYNWDIQQKRAGMISIDFLRWLDIMRGGYKIDRIHIFGMADWISGDIHEELVRTNDAPPPVQAVSAGLLLGEQVLRFAANAGEVEFHPVGVDNHGRLSKKYQFKDAYVNSWNFVVYEVMKQYTSDVKNFKFHEPQGLKQFTTVGRFNFLLEHGHMLRGWMGLPHYSIQRSKGREANKRMKMERAEWRKEMDVAKKQYGFDYNVIAHFHVGCKPDYDALMNGSLCGTNELDHASGRYAPPTQCAFLVGHHGWFNHCDFGGI